MSDHEQDKDVTDLDGELNDAASNAGTRSTESMRDEPGAATDDSSVDDSDDSDDVDGPDAPASSQQRV